MRMETTSSGRPAGLIRLTLRPRPPGRRKNLEKGRPPLFSGAGEQTYLLLSRLPLGRPPAKPDLVGEWQMLTILDDAGEKTWPGPQHERRVLRR